jgi:polyhydroxybutyrate depolymerase
LHVPESYDKNRPIPLVIALHGRGEMGFLMADKTGFSDKADEGDFIVVYPNGLGGFLFFKWWNAGIYWPIFMSNRNIDDVTFIKVLIERLQSIFNINSSRIYVTGHSNGGMMAYRIGAELSTKIAAIAPVAGTIGGKETKNSKPYIIPEPSSQVSVIAFHGKKDLQIPYEGGRFGGLGLRKPYFLSVNDSVSFWVENNNCSSIPKINVSESENIIKKTYSNSDNTTDVVLYSVVNGGHEWFGSSWDPSCEISATDIIWDFFMSHPKK